jgi:CDP-2,3-bis-(O-geranylgeranyl)-sn-glycerol synthase
MVTNTLLFALWFFFPASVANMTPVFAAKVPLLKSLNFPLDFNIHLNGKRLIGSHKSLRGLLAGILMGTLAAYLELILYKNDPSLRTFIPIYYTSEKIVLIGFLLSLGALTGNTIKSILKRQKGIKQGDSWFPYDEMDYIIGALLFTLPVIQLSLEIYIMILFIWFFLYPAALLMQGYLKIEKNPRR